MKRAFLVSTLLACAPAARAAAECVPAAVVDGPAAAVQALTKALVERGVRVEPAGLPPGECGALRVSIAGADPYTLAIADPWGRSAERKVADLATAATLVESWARMELLESAHAATSSTTANDDAADASTAATNVRSDGATAPAARAEDATTLAAQTAAPADGAGTRTASAAGAATPANAAVIEASPFLWRLSAEAGTSRDRRKWVGAAASFCARVWIFCFGASTRYSAAAEGGNAADLMIDLDLPIAMGPLTIIPGIGAGVGWIDGGDELGFETTQVTESVLARTEAHVSASLQLSDDTHLQLGAAWTSSPSFGRRFEMEGVRGATIVRGYAGVLWGTP